MKIFSFPKTNHNHYQELLYTQMRRKGDTVSYIYFSPYEPLSPFLFLPYLFFGALFGYRVVHIHWTSAFSIPTKTLSYWHYRVCLGAMKFLGYKLVWTAHNVLPHEHIFPDDAKARRELVDHADLVIAHSELTLDGLKKIGITPRNAIVIPHGNYIGTYPNTLTREAARQKLGLAPDVFVYLHLGWAKGYKGIDDLKAAYEKIKSPKNYLIIAGKGTETGYISDDDLQVYFNAADVIVLPFKEITTSGSALLALSFGKAVIVPRLGELAKLPEAIAYKYSPDEETGLLNAMKAAEKDLPLLREKSKAALAYAEELNWPMIAKRTREAILKLFPR